MTSLAKQLQRLAVPHTQSTLSEDRSRESLLFDPKEAAGIDRETFHALGVNGLEELENIDVEFQEFEKSLFGNASITFERSMQTKEVNAKLDESLSRFLVRLSPYCLLRPAHKALEWLIYRFHVHFYNTDDLLLCFMPYHESKIFVRVLQLVKFDSKLASKWDWLQPCQKSGIHLSRSTLLNHCSSDPAFLAFVCDSVPRAVKVTAEGEKTAPKCRVLFSFYTTLVIGVLETGKVTEQLVSALLLYISRGVQSASVEYKAASYMILAQLLHKTQLKTSVLKTLQQIVTKHLVMGLMLEGLSCLLLMFQTQDMSTVVLTKKSFKHLSRHNVVEAIGQLSEQYDSREFLSCLLYRLIPASFKQAIGMATSGESSESDSEGRLPSFMSMLHRLLSVVELTDDVAKKAACQFLKMYVAHGDHSLEKAEEDRLKASLQGIVRLLEGRYSAMVDVAVQTVMKETQSEEGRQLIQDFLNLYVLSVPHQLLEEGDTNLVLSLNHRLPEVRKRAVRTLLQNKHKVEDPSFLKDSILLRLQDDSPDVVRRALDIGKDIWSVVGDDKQVITLLLSSVRKVLHDGKWMNVCSKALEVLCGYAGEQQMMIIPGLLPFLFLVSTNTFFRRKQTALLGSQLAGRSRLLKRVALEWQKHQPTDEDKASVDALNVVMATCLAEGVLGYEGKDILQMVTSWTQKSTLSVHPVIPCMMMVVIDNLVTMASDSSLKLKLCGRQLELVKTIMCGECAGPVRKLKQGEVTLEWSLLMSRHSGEGSSKKIPAIFCGRAVHGLLHCIGLPPDLQTGTSMWRYGDGSSEREQFLHLALRLFHWLMEQSATTTRDTAILYRSLVTTFMQAWFAEPVCLMKFLGLLWTGHASDHAADLTLTPVLQAWALKLGLVHIQNLDSPSQAAVLQSASPVMVSLLVALTSPQAALRKLAVSCAQALLSKAQESKSKFLPLLKKIVRCEEEHCSDALFVQQVVKSVLGKSKTDSSSPRHRTRKSSGGQDGSQTCLQSLLGVISQQSTPGYMQRALLGTFSLLNTPEVLQSLFPLMAALLDKDGSTVSRTEADILNALIRKFVVGTAGLLTPDSQGLSLFLRALKTSVALSADAESAQLTALDQVTKQLYEAVEDGVQQQLLSALLDVWVDTENLVVANKIRKVVKHLSLNAVHIADELKQCLTVPAAANLREAKRLRREPVEGRGAESGAEFESAVWQRVTVVLEAVQNKKKLQYYTVLVSSCFHILARVLESESHVTAEYIKQLLLSLLYTLCCRMEGELDEEGVVLVPERQFKMELIVNCIRSSENPQTHRQALLVLTSAAKIYPEHLLHNMMSVFAFMGANILRQDDAYSFQIISRILETVIPSLITACEQRKKVPRGITNNLEDLITMVIQVFVDSYPHIPEHRRHLLFTKLVSVIGEQDYLWRTLLLMMRLVVTKGTLKAELDSLSHESNQGGLPPRDIEFCLGLCAEFPPFVQLSTAKFMVSYLTKLPEDKDYEDAKKVRTVPQSFGKLRKEDVHIFDVEMHTAKQLRHFKYATVQLLASLVSSTDFLAQCAVDEEAELLQSFQGALEAMLQYITKVSKATNKFSDKPTAKFWKALQHKTYELLDKLVSLLPDRMFLEVVSGLVSHDLPNIQRKAMDLLNTKLQQQKTGTTAEEESQLLPLVGQLQHLIQQRCTGQGEVTEEVSVNCQTAFISLKLLCRKIGSNHPDKFQEVLKVAIEVFASCHGNQPVAACALLCVAECCTTLKIHTIQHLPAFMPKIIASMEEEDGLLQNDLFLLSVLTTVNKVVENLSHFLSPYLLDILYHVSSLLGQLDSTVLHKPQVLLKLKSIRQTLATSVPMRVLLPSVASCYERLLENKLLCTSHLLLLLGDHIGHVGRDELISHMTQLQTFFLTCLDLRLQHPEVSEKRLISMEAVTIESIITMVMKLSEATFKPFLFKLYDWATSSEEHRERVLVFYKLADSLAEKLKSLFCLFAGHVVNHAAKMLDLNNKAKQATRFFESDKKKRKKSSCLLVYILDCLHKCFLYDTEGFITKERFNSLMQPLVNQLENQQGSEKTYEERVNKHLVPCIIQLAVVAQDDSLWRSLNYQICLKTRHSQPEVRCAGLKALEGLHKKLGDDYMNLLPETIPFLAELMEDDSEDVEKLCQTVISGMEKTLGEPLQKYF